MAKGSFNFDSIRSAGRVDNTAEIEIRGLLGMKPVLICRPATRSTPAYFNKVLKRQRIGRGRLDMTVESLDGWLEDDIELLAEHCVVGFKPGTVIDVDGSELPFSVDACKALFSAIYAEDRKHGTSVWEEFCADIRDPATFRAMVDPEDVRRQAGN